MKSFLNFIRQMQLILANFAAIQGVSHIFAFGGNSYQRQKWGQLTALFSALASVLFVAGGATALQAALLAAADWHGHAVGQNGLGAAFTVCFGSDFVGHGGLQ
jgi:hypothetical protein